eukprot:132211-Rhodomonas_salina.1
MSCHSHVTSALHVCNRASSKVDEADETSFALQAYLSSTYLTRALVFRRSHPGSCLATTRAGECQARSAPGSTSTLRLFRVASSTCTPTPPAPPRQVRGQGR